MIADRDWLVERTEFDTNGGCWLWSGSTAPGGYGRCMVARRYWLVHRLSWTDANGPIPAGMLVRHKCDVPTCFNPNHLEIGTHSDNSLDCLLRGRVNRTSKRGPAMTEDQLRFIRERLAEGWRDRRIAEALGVSRNAIGRHRRKMAYAKADAILSTLLSRG